MDVSSKSIKSEWLRSLCAVGVLAGLVVGMFLPVLMRGNKIVLSRTDLDISSYFLPVREWGFRALAKGNLAMWNPHILCGTPFFGNLQSALLYPPNWVFLVTGAAFGINISIALHVFLAGLFTYFWCRVRGTSRVAAVMAGAIFMFGGSFFYKILAGHLAIVCAAAWVPFILMCIDKLFFTGRLQWALWGGLAVAMQVLSGNVQYAYYTGLVAGLYTLLNLVRHRQNLSRVVIGIALIYILGGMLSSWQVLMGAQLESMRSQGLDLDKATVGSIPPTKFIALLAPMPYRDDILALNVSVVGFMLAIVGAIMGEKGRRRFSVTMAILMAILAAGNFTPIYRLLYDHFPGFNYFRVVGRFGAFCSLFLAMLAAIGFDRLCELKLSPRWAIVLPVVLGIFVVALGMAVLLTRNAQGGGVAGVMERIDWGAPLGKVSLQKIRSNLAPWLGWMLLIAGGIYAAAAALLIAMRRKPASVYGLAVLAIAELCVTAHLCIGSPSVLRVEKNAQAERLARISGVARTLGVMRVPPYYSPTWYATLRHLKEDERTYHLSGKDANRAMSFGTHDINGYEAVVLGRTRMVLDALKQANEGRPNDLRPLLPYAGVWEMLRVKYIMVHKPERAYKLAEPMKPVELVDAACVVADADAALDAVLDPSFDPRKVVFLESEPTIRPQAGGAKGSAKIVRSTTDEMEITADLPKPAILLVTDAYSSHWHATALSGSSQQSYEVMPANVMLRAIPLGAGKHHLLLRYRPRFYALGQWVSGLTAAGCAIAAAIIAIGGVRKWRRQRVAVEESAVAVG